MDSPQFEAARQRIEDLIRELTPTIGPIDGFEGGEIDDNSMHIEAALLAEWVLVCSWVDPVSGEPFVVRLSSAQMPGHHRDGLLFQALYRMED